MSKEQATLNTVGVTSEDNGFLLLDLIDQDEPMPWLNEVSAVHTWRNVWEQHYQRHNGYVKRLTPQQDDWQWRVDSSSL